VEECVALEVTIAVTNLLCFSGFRTAADDPPKPWRRWVCFLGTTGLPVGLHFLFRRRLSLNKKSLRKLKRVEVFFQKLKGQGSPRFQRLILKKMIFSIINCTHCGLTDETFFDIGNFK